MSILAIADCLRPGFKKIADMEVVDMKVGRPHVAAIVDLLYRPDVAKHLPGSRERERMMFREDKRTIVKAFEDIVEDLERDCYDLGLVRETMKKVLEEWQRRYPMVLSDLSDPNYLAGTVNAIAASVAWLTMKQGGEVEEGMREMVRRAREELLSGGHAGSARSTQEGAMEFFERVGRWLPTHNPSESSPS